jgi:hypothetical protein
MELLVALSEFPIRSLAFLIKAHKSGVSCPNQINVPVTQKLNLTSIKHATPLCLPFSLTSQPFLLISRVFDRLFERQPASMTIVFMRLDRMTTSSATVHAQAADLQALFLEDHSSHTYILTSPFHHVVDILYRYY